MLHYSSKHFYTFIKKIIMFYFKKVFLKRKNVTKKNIKVRSINSIILYCQIKRSWEV